MILGLKKNEVKLVPYISEWKDEFTNVKRDIMQHTKFKANQIEHIGSTAIEGMCAKPVLDIIIGLNSIENVSEEIFRGLKSVGFLRLKVERPKEIILAKFTDNTCEVRTHYIHLVAFQKELWNNLTFFRDYLNTNEQSREEYSTIKLSYLSQSSTGIEDYTNHKEAFVKKIFNKRMR